MSGDAALLAVSFVLGAAGGAGGWYAMSHIFHAPLFGRTNVRGAQVPVAVGLIIPLALVGSAAVLALMNSASVAEVPLGPLHASVLGAAGFALVGLLDDLAGDRSAEGFRGHLRSLRDGRLTTGAVKLFGGGAVALVAVAPTGADRPGRLVADAALVALAANLANLLDRAPGRVGKVTLLAAVPVLAAAGADLRLAGPVAVLGALVVLVRPDLNERLMLGDTGANVLGGTLGLAVVMTAAPSTRLAALAVVAALNVASELVSFSRVIERTAVLRWLDGLGRLRPRR